MSWLLFIGTTLLAGSARYVTPLDSEPMRFEARSTPLCRVTIMDRGVSVGALSWCETDAQRVVRRFPIRFDGDFDSSARLFFETVIADVIASEGRE